MIPRHRVNQRRRRYSDRPWVELARVKLYVYLGKAMVAHVLTMLGGPMERMESWGPPGRNKRRPCKVRVCWPHGFSRFSSSGDREYWVYTALLGGVKNYHATD